MTQWHHAPVHHTKATGAYMITGSTHGKAHYFSSPASLDMLQSVLLQLIQDYGLKIRAWSLFANHYHLILLTFQDSSPLNSFINHFHSMSSRKLNTLDKTTGRKVWFQYWDTRLTYIKSYYARLKYVMQNPVKHGLVTNAIQYPWCSAQWFEKNAHMTFQRTVQSFKVNTISVVDDF